MKLESIEKMIKQLEQSADTIDNIRELANLYIVREFLKQEKAE